MKTIILLAICAILCTCVVLLCAYINREVNEYLAEKRRDMDRIKNLQRLNQTEKNKNGN